MPPTSTAATATDEVRNSNTQFSFSVCVRHLFFVVVVNLRKLRSGMGEQGILDGAGCVCLFHCCEMESRSY